MIYAGYPMTDPKEENCLGRRDDSQEESEVLIGQTT